MPMACIHALFRACCAAVFHRAQKCHGCKHLLIATCPNTLKFVHLIDFIDFFAAQKTSILFQPRCGAVVRPSTPAFSTKLSTETVGETHIQTDAITAPPVAQGWPQSWAIIAFCPPRAETRQLLSIIQAAGWPIWPLIACSVLALALIFERFISLKSTRIIPPKLLDEAISVSSQSLPGPDVVGKLAQNSALGEVLATGLRTLNSNPRSTEADLRAAMEGAGRVVAHRLEKS